MNFAVAKPKASGFAKTFGPAMVDMNVTVETPTRGPYCFDVAARNDVSTLFQLLEQVLAIPQAQLVLIFEGVRVTVGQTFDALGAKNGDVFYCMNG
jgi:hypothetical protein